MDLDASDEQLDCPFVYASAKAGHAILDLTDDEMEVLVTNKNEFKTYINYLRRYAVPEEENIYYYKRHSEKYLRVEELYENAKYFGIIVDVTEEKTN